MIQTCQSCATRRAFREEVSCEVCGNNSWTYACARHGGDALALPCPACAFAFGGTVYYSPKPLARAFARECYPSLAPQMQSALREWVEQSLGDPKLLSTLNKIMNDPLLDPPCALTVT